MLTHVLREPCPLFKSYFGVFQYIGATPLFCVCTYVQNLTIYRLAQSHALFQPVGKTAKSSMNVDFVKAFDKVPHVCLCHKLSHFGLMVPFLEWIKSFLTERSQQVIVNGEKILHLRQPREYHREQFQLHFWFCASLMTLYEKYFFLNQIICK